jgi:hypothetical protein
MTEPFYRDFNGNPIAEPYYGSFDGIPSRYDANEAWVFHGGDAGWVEINSASHGNAVRELTKADFAYLNRRRLPPLPPEAFTGDDGLRQIASRWRSNVPVPDTSTPLLGSPHDPATMAGREEIVPNENDFQVVTMAAAHDRQIGQRLPGDNL